MALRKVFDSLDDNFETVEVVSQFQFEQLQNFLVPQARKNIAYQAIANNLVYASRSRPMAIPSDIWLHIIYRTYRESYI